MKWLRRLFGIEATAGPPVDRALWCDWCGRTDLYAGIDLCWHGTFYGHACLERIRFEEIKKLALENVRRGENHAAAFHHAEQSIDAEEKLYGLFAEKEREYRERAKASAVPGVQLG